MICLNPDRDGDAVGAGLERSASTLTGIQDDAAAAFKAGASGSTASGPPASSPSKPAPLSYVDISSKAQSSSVSRSDSAGAGHGAAGAGAAGGPYQRGGSRHAQSSGAGEQTLGGDRASITEGERREQLLALKVRPAWVALLCTDCCGAGLTPRCLIDPSPSSALPHSLFLSPFASRRSSDAQRASGHGCVLVTHHWASCMDVRLLHALTRSVGALQRESLYSVSPTHTPLLPCAWPSSAIQTSACTGGQAG